MSQTLQYLGPELLESDPDNLREVTLNGPGLTELAYSIVANGLIEPIVVRWHLPPADEDGQPDGEYRIIAGHRRKAAIDLVNEDPIRFGADGPIVQVPCLVRDFDDDRADVTVLQLVENLQRVDLDPIEESAGYLRLVTELKAFSIKELAATVGRSERHIRERIALAALPPLARKALRDGCLTVEQANRLGKIAVQMPAEVVDIAEDALSDEVGVWAINRNIELAEAKVVNLKAVAKLKPRLAKLGLTVVESEDELIAAFDARPGCDWEVEEEVDGVEWDGTSPDQASLARIYVDDRGIAIEFHVAVDRPADAEPAPVDTTPRSERQKAEAEQRTLERQRTQAEADAKRKTAEREQRKADKERKLAGVLVQQDVLRALTRADVNKAAVAYLLGEVSQYNAKEICAILGLERESWPTEAHVQGYGADQKTVQRVAPGKAVKEYAAKSETNLIKAVAAIVINAVTSVDGGFSFPKWTAREQARDIVQAAAMAKGVSHLERGT